MLLVAFRVGVVAADGESRAAAADQSLAATQGHLFSALDVDLDQIDFLNPLVVGPLIERDDFGMHLGHGFGIGSTRRPDAGVNAVAVNSKHNWGGLVADGQALDCNAIGITVFPRILLKRQVHHRLERIDMAARADGIGELHRPRADVPAEVEDGFTQFGTNFNRLDLRLDVRLVQDQPDAFPQRGFVGDVEMWVKPVIATGDAIVRLAAFAKALGNHSAPPRGAVACCATLCPLPSHVRWKR